MPLLMVKLYPAKEQVEAVVDTVASASVVGNCLARNLEIWTRGQKIKVRQGDRSSWGGNFVINTSLKVMDSYLVLGKFVLDAEVLDIGNKEVILELSWLTENGFSMDT